MRTKVEEKDHVKCWWEAENKFESVKEKLQCIELNRHGRLFNTIVVKSQDYCNRGERLDSTLLK